MSIKNKLLFMTVIYFFVAGTAQAQIGSAGETRAAVARVQDTGRPIFGTAALGPAFTSGLESGGPMYNVIAALNYNFSREISGKIIGDLAWGGGDNAERFFNFGLGADYSPMAWVMGRTTPYVTADAGLGLTRNAGENEENGLAFGAGGGLRFLAQRMNWDVNLHYTLLTAQNEGSTPSVLGVRGGVNF